MKQLDLDTFWGRPCALCFKKNLFANFPGDNPSYVFRPEARPEEELSF